MMPGGAASRVPGLGQQPPAATIRPSMWYRFHVDLTANPSGVSVKSLIREAESARRKAAAAAAASSVARVSPRPSGSTAPFPNGGAATTSGPGTAITPAAPGNGANGSNGSATPGVRGGAGVAAVGPPRQPGSAGGDFVATTGEANGMGLRAGEAGAAERPTADTTNAKDVTGPEQSEPARVKNTAEDIHHPASELLGDKKRKVGGMSLIERLELKYGGVASGFLPDSDEESSEMSSVEEPSSAEESGEGGGGDDDATEGGVRSGGENGAKKVVKRTRKVLDDLDYDDTFIDDSELLKAFIAKEVSENVKTVHSGFFANQGEVETIEESSDENDGSKKKGSGGGDGDFVQKRKKRPSNEKPKASEAGKSVDAAVPPKKKPKKKPAVGDGGGAGGVGGATSTETAVTTKASATAAASAVSVVGKSSPIADTVGPVSSAATCAAGNVVNAANTGDNAVQPAVASVATREGGRGDGVGATVGVAAAGASTLGVQGQVAATSSSSLGSNAATAAMVAAAQQNKATGGTSGIPVAATQVGSFVSSERDAASAVAVGSSSGATAAAGGGGAGKGGGALKTAAANTVLMVQSLDPALKVALARFEEDSRPWVDAGRPEGDASAAAAVLDGLLKLDALVRQSVETTHVPPVYVERLSAIYGKSALEIKGMLLGLRREENKRENARLRDELDSLKTEFAQKVAANVAAQKVADGQPQSPPFHWTDPLRGLLHDLMRAFEAWATKTLSGLRTKQAIIASKELYDQLSQAWPAELPMTPDDLKKMYLNEKRRIKTKANKEAAAETSPATPKTAPAAGSPIDLNREPVAREGVNKAAALGTATATTAPSPPPPPSAASQHAATGAATAGSTVVAAGVTVASPAASSNSAGAPSAAHAIAVSPLTATCVAGPAAVVAAPSTPASMPPPLPTTSTVPAVEASPRSAPVPAGASTASVASSPHAFMPMPTAAAGTEQALPVPAVAGASRSYGAPADTRPSSPLFVSPPRAVTFDAPPEFDESDFFDEVDDDEDGVEEVYDGTTPHRGYESVTDGQ